MIGLPDIRFLGVEDGPGRRGEDPRRDGGPVGGLPKVRSSSTGEGPHQVELVDLSLKGRPSRVVWRKHRWMCPDVDCPMGSWTEEDDRIARTSPAVELSSGLRIKFQRPSLAELTPLRHDTGEPRQVPQYVLTETRAKCSLSGGLCRIREMHPSPHLAGIRRLLL